MLSFTLKRPLLPLLISAALSTGPAFGQEADLAQIATFFETAQIVDGPTEVDCTLSGGTQTTCFSITVSHVPQTYTPGPWCPTNIADGAEAGGIWFLDGETVDVDGTFIASLAEVYGDTNWQLYDPQTGDVRFTGTLEACEAAARPDVDPTYQNHCVQCLPEYLPDDATLTYVIPLEPVLADATSATNAGGSGIAANGVRLDGPAPVDAIIGAYTIAPFDDCGGHINPHVGYHYHAVTDCLSGAPTTVSGADLDVVSGHGGQIGVAMDGQAIFPPVLADASDPGDLDACNGHASDGLPYHYNAGSVGSNQILGCLAAETGCTLVEGETVCDASSRRPRP